MAEYYLATGGSDADDGLTPSTPKATFGAAIALLTSAGDRLNIMADGTHDISGHSPSDVPDTGTPASPNMVRGVNALGVADGTRARLTWPESLASSFHDREWYVYEDLILDDFADNRLFTVGNWILRRIRVETDSSWLVRVANRVVCVDCEFLTTRTTFNSQLSSQVQSFIRCFSVSGFVGGENRGATSFFDCVAKGPNVGIGFNMGASSNFAQLHLMRGCVVDGAGTGIRVQNQNQMIQNCTVVNCSGDGIEMPASSNGVLSVRDCIIANNGGYGINDGGGMLIDEADNFFHNNTSGSLSSGSIDPSSSVLDPQLGSLLTPGAAAVINRARTLLRGTLDPLTTYNDAGGIRAEPVGLGGGTTLVLPSGLRSVM